MSPKIKPKIAILSLRNSYTYGGVLTSLKVMYNFCQQYFEPTVFYLSFDPTISTSLKQFKFSSSTQETIFEGMNCIEVGARWAFWEPGHYKFSLPVWQNLLAEYDYCVAVSGTPICAHPLALLNKKYGLYISTPYISDREERVKKMNFMRRKIDTLAHPAMTKIENQILNRAGYIWALSEYSRASFDTPSLRQEPALDLIQGYGGHSGRALDRCPIITHCGYPMDIALDTGFHRYDHKKKNIIAVGRYSDPRKNINILLKSFDLIWNQHPDCKLYVVGKTPEESVLDQFRNVGSFKNVIFTGRVSDEQLNNYLKNAWLMLITAYQEGFCIAGLEAMKYGVPVITTNCGGPLDYVIDGQTGFVVEINDFEAMASKASMLLSKQELLTQMSKNVQTLLKEKFSTEKIHSNFKQGLLTMYPELNQLKGDK